MLFQGAEQFFFGNISAHNIHTPLSVPRMRKLLLNHPNRPLAHFVMSGLLHGFGIGFRGSRDINIVGANLSSAAMQPDFVSTYLAKCCSLNELLGLFTSNPFPFSHCSGVGCVPKKSSRLRLAAITASGSCHQSGTNGLWVLPFERRSGLRVLPSQRYSTPAGVPACANSGYKTQLFIASAVPNVDSCLIELCADRLRLCESG